MVDERDIDVLNVGVDRHVILGEVRIDDPSVALPVPMSCEPDWTRREPSGCNTARADALTRCAGYDAVAMPKPTSLPRSRVDRGRTARCSQPNRPAACR